MADLDLWWAELCQVTPTPALDILATFWGPEWVHIKNQSEALVRSRQDVEWDLARALPPREARSLAEVYLLAEIVDRQSEGGLNAAMRKATSTELGVLMMEEPSAAQYELRNGIVISALAARRVVEATRGAQDRLEAAWRKVHEIETQVLGARLASGDFALHPFFLIEEYARGLRVALQGQKRSAYFVSFDLWYAYIDLRAGDDFGVDLATSEFDRCRIGRDKAYHGALKNV